MRISFREAIGLGFKNYVNFTGRSSRAEYWWWALFSGLINLALNVAYFLLLGAGSGAIENFNLGFQHGLSGQTYDPSQFNAVTVNPSLLIAALVVRILTGVFGLALFLPSLALLVRRLRDAGHRWTVLLWPLLGLPIYVVGLGLAAGGIVAASQQGSTDPSSLLALAGVGGLLAIIGGIVTFGFEIMIFVFLCMPPKEDTRFISAWTTYEL